jgi:hypothetical protein
MDDDNSIFAKGSNGQSVFDETLPEKTGELSQLAPSINHTMEFALDEAYVITSPK